MKRLAITLFFALLIFMSVVVLIVERKSCILPMAWAYGFYYIAKRYMIGTARLLFCVAIVVDIVVYLCVREGVLS